MKKLLFSFYLLMVAMQIYALEPQDMRVDAITADWLITEECADHIPLFQEIFRRKKMGGMLEFGLGFSTKYFLDNCKKVISVDFVTYGSGPEWMQKFLPFYDDFSNWIPIAYLSRWPGDTSWAPFKYFGSEHVYNACSYQCATCGNYAELDDFYLKELDSFFDNICLCHAIELAFVNSSNYLRGDIVSQLFHRIPIIVANNTNARQNKDVSDVYGYKRVKTPQEYEEIAISEGSCITIWVLRSEKYNGLIQSLKTYVKRLEG